MQSNQADIIQQNEQTYSISGTVDFSTVPELMQSATLFFKGFDKLTATEKIRIDMSQVTLCNSAALALVLEMAKAVRAYKREIQFENLPDSLLIIAKAYGIEEEIRDFT